MEKQPDPEKLKMIVRKRKKRPREKSEEERDIQTKRRKIIEEIKTALSDLPDNILLLVLATLNIEAEQKGEKGMTLKDFTTIMSILGKVHYTIISKSRIIWMNLFKLLLLRKNRWSPMLKTYENIWTTFIKDKLHLLSVASFWKGAYEYNLTFDSNPMLSFYSQNKPATLAIKRWGNIEKQIDLNMNDYHDIIYSPSVKILETYGSIIIYSFPLKSVEHNFPHAEIRGIFFYDITKRRILGRMIFPQKTIIDYIKVSNEGKLYIVTLLSPLLHRLKRTGIRILRPHPRRTHTIYVFEQIHKINWNKFVNNTIPSFHGHGSHVGKQDWIEFKEKNFDLTMNIKEYIIDDQYLKNHLQEMPIINQYDSYGNAVELGFDKCSYAINNNFIAIGYTTEITSKPGYIKSNIHKERDFTTKILIFNITSARINRKNAIKISDPQTIDIRKVFRNLIENNLLSMNLYEHWRLNLKYKIVEKDEDGDDDDDEEPTRDDPSIDVDTHSSQRVYEMRMPDGELKDVLFIEDNQSFVKSKLTSFLTLNGENGLIMDDNNNIYIVPYLGPLTINKYEFPQLGIEHMVYRNKIYISQTLSCAFKLDPTTTSKQDPILLWPPSDPTKFKNHISQMTSIAPQQALYYPHIIKLFTGYMSKDRIIALYYINGDYHVKKARPRTQPDLRITKKYKYRLFSKLNFTEIDINTGYIIRTNFPSRFNPRKFIPSPVFPFKFPAPGIPMDHEVISINDITFSRNFDKLVYMVRENSRLQLHVVSLLTGMGQLDERRRDYLTFNRSNQVSVYQLNKFVQNNLHHVFFKLRFASGFLIIDKTLLRNHNSWPGVVSNNDQTIILTTLPGILLASNINNNTQTTTCFNPDCVYKIITHDPLKEQNKLQQQAHICTHCYDAVYCSKQCQLNHYADKKTPPQCFQSKK